MKKEKLFRTTLCTIIIALLFIGTGINAFALETSNVPETHVTVDNVEYYLNHFKYAQGAEYHVIYSGKASGDIVIPDEINGIPVTCICSSAFEPSSIITSVTIGNNVKVIESRAFRNCSSLSTVTFGENVTEIGEKAFEGCYSLTSIHLSDSVEKIGSYAFSKCFNLRSFVSGMGLKELGENVFSDTNYINVVIPDSVTLNETNYDPNLLFVASLDDRLREEQKELPAQIEEEKAQLEYKLNRLEAINAYFNESTRTASIFGDGNVTLIIIGAVLIVAALGIGLLIGKKLPAKKRS